MFCDVRQPDDLERLVATALDRYGKIDGLVNNAGANFVKPFLKITLNEWEDVLSVDLRATFLLTQLVCRQMEKSPEGGSIVNISSVHSHAVLPGSGPYDAAKWGVVGLSKASLLSWRQVRYASTVFRLGCSIQISGEISRPLHLIRIPAASIGMRTSPIARVIEPAEIGELAAFLLSDRSSCITGSNIFADGGMTSQLVSREPYTSKHITL